MFWLHRSPFVEPFYESDGGSRHYIADKLAVVAAADRPWRHLVSDRVAAQHLANRIADRQHALGIASDHPADQLALGIASHHRTDHCRANLGTIVTGSNSEWSDLWSDHGTSFFISVSFAGLVGSNVDPIKLTLNHTDQLRRPPWRRRVC